MHAVTTGTDNPLIGAPPEEVHLSDPPLERVICQVRFPTILAVRRAEGVIGFQEAIRSNYPILQEDQVRNLKLRVPGEYETENDVIWRFSDQSRNWRASLASGFVSLETTEYESRHGFLHRLQEVLEAVEETLKPQVTSRVGLRYINRIVGPAFDSIETMVRAEVLGLAATPLGPRAGRMLSEAWFDAKEGALAIRWGRVPANFSPGASIEAIESPSWIIDIDMYDDSEQRFEAQALTELSRTFAERVYAIFRWTVTTALLRHYGGDP